jgi:S-(hydroxymethyl)glutathione dehydrogenase / alcohol dehydrogenase
MRAAVLHDGSDDLVIEEIEATDLGPREVLIRTAACGLCHSDLHVLDGTLQRPRPHVLGHEAAGVVAAVGGGVTSVAVGDHVVTCLVQGCGTCIRCEQGEPALCRAPSSTRRPAGQPSRLRTADGRNITVMGNVGGLTEQMVIDERGLVGIDPDVPMHLAAILGCAVVTGLGAVFNVAKVRPGQSVAVLGCGGVGLNVIQGARIAGASQIIAIDMADQKLEMASRLGATDVVNASTADAVEAVLGLSDGGVDHAFEVVGRPATIEQAMAMTAPGRNTYVLGVMADDATFTATSEYTKRGRSMIGVFMGSTQPRVDIPRYIQMWRRGQLDLESMVSRLLSLDEVNDGFRALAHGEVNRAVVMMNDAQNGQTEQKGAQP